MAKPKKKSAPGGLQFEANGVVYGFVVNKFFVPGFGELTPETALANEEALAYLVSEKSQVIAEASDEVAATAAPAASVAPAIDEEKNEEGKTEGGQA